MNAKSWLKFRNTGLGGFLSRDERMQIEVPQLSDLPQLNRNAGKKILIVDDDLVILKTTSFKLKASGYTVLTSADCADAIRVVREELPHLILLDVHFPPDVAHGGGVPWDGFLVMNWMRTVLHATRVPVIFITGVDSPELRDRALAMGATGMFVKPLHHGRLIEFIEKILGQKNGSSDPRSESSFQS
jgi:DNA-binding response OmpR family regulator